MVSVCSALWCVLLVAALFYADSDSVKAGLREHRTTPARQIAHVDHTHAHTGCHQLALCFDLQKIRWCVLNCKNNVAW